MKNLIRPMAALALLVVVTGCNSSKDTASPTADTRSEALKFADCMRSHGVTNFPDPDSSGTYTADGIANDSGVDTSSAAWTRAIAACKSLEPAGFTGTKRSTQQQSVAIKFAQCIRENGVPDFPDPEPNSPLVDTNRIPSSNSKGGMTTLNAAMKTCGKVFDGQLGLKK